MDHEIGCYDRNDNPEEYITTFPHDSDFCNKLGDLCDAHSNIKSDDPHCNGERGKEAFVYCDLKPEGVK
jgi:hypothetical protein